MFCALQDEILCDTSPNASETTNQQVGCGRVEYQRVRIPWANRDHIVVPELQHSLTRLMRRFTDSVELVLSKHWDSRDWTESALSYQIAAFTYKFLEMIWLPTAERPNICSNQGKILKCVAVSTSK
jgi:hypothetical protein